MSSFKPPLLKLSLVLLLAGCAASQQARSTPAIPGSGLRFVPPEELRGIPLAELPYAGYELPRRMDLSPKMPPPGHQQQQNSCAAWATAYAVKTYQEKVELQHALTDKGKPRWQHIFSPAFVYNQINQGRDGGATLVDALNLLRARGAISWADMPYLPDNITHLPSAAQLKKARQYRIAYWRQVNVADPMELKSQLHAGYPVMVGALIDEGFYGLRTDRPWQTYDGSRKQGHALVLVGFDDHKQAFKVMNSWGRNWGKNGYGWISYRQFRKSAREAYVAKDAWNQPVAAIGGIAQHPPPPAAVPLMKPAAPQEPEDKSREETEKLHLSEAEPKKDLDEAPNAQAARKKGKPGNVSNAPAQSVQSVPEGWNVNQVQWTPQFLILEGSFRRKTNTAIMHPEIILRFYNGDQKIAGILPRYQQPDGQLAALTALTPVSGNAYRWKTRIPRAAWPESLSEKSVFDAVLYSDKFGIAKSDMFGLLEK